MLRNYIKIATRNLLKHKAFSIINISGLAVGITCCVLLALYVNDELSYEKHFSGFDRTYRITSFFNSNDGEHYNPRTSPPIAMRVLAEFPEVENATRVVSPPEVEQHLIQYNDKSFYEKKGYLVDSTFFQVFNFAFQEGNAETALDAPSSVVLTSPLAEKLFGNQSAIDELIVITSGGSMDTFRVDGVLKPLEKKSHLDADFYMSMNSRGWGEWINNITTWAGQNFIYSYVRLRPGTSLEQTEVKLAELLEKNGGKELKETGMNKTLHLQALTDINLFSSQYLSDLSPKGNITYLYILSSIGIFILLIACINFMNLTTAKSGQRACEVGVRKTMGATRSSLARQFLGESIVLVIVATLLSIAFIQVSLPFFNHITQKQLSLSGINIFFLASALSLVAVVTGLLAGSYPAFYLSSFQPAVVLKNKHLGGGGHNGLRKAMVVFQFVISITLISSLAVIYSQMDFIRSQSLGFEPDYNVTIPLRTLEAKKAYAQTKNHLQALSGVVNVSASTSLPATFTLRDFSLYKPGTSMQEAIHHFVVYTDEEYFKTLGITFKAGRDFTYETDSSRFEHLQKRVIVNEESLKQLGIPLDEAVGSFILTDINGNTLHHEIIGVVSDFHQFSFHEAISPMIFAIPAGKEDYIAMTVSVAAGNYASFINQVEKIWKELNPNTPFESVLLSQYVKRQYESDERMAQIITIFTSIAIIISCLGLYGLSIYVAERRTKEIGIRKVMGASVAGIVSMLTTDFIKLVALAFVIAAPVSYYMMREWLDTFTYRIELNAWIFLVAGFISFIVAWLTVGFESIKAAISNPVDSLRSE